MFNFTFEELSLIRCALEDLLGESRTIAADRKTTVENRGLARKQVKAIRSIFHRLDKELSKYPAEQTFSIIQY